MYLFDFEINISSESRLLDAVLSNKQPGSSNGASLLILITLSTCFGSNGSVRVLLQPSTADGEE